MIKNNSDLSWERIARLDPYFGILAADKFRKENIDNESRAQFYETGRIHVEKVLNTISQHFSGIALRGAALDFGCGIGRLVLPLAAKFDCVLGVDVSPTMLAAAKENLTERNITNVSLSLSDDSLARVSQTYDLIHSYIVLQHIPVSRGEKIIQQLIDRLNPGGVLAIQFPFRRKASALRKSIVKLRENLAPVAWLLNMIRGRRWNEPLMQMNDYDLNRILRILSDSGINDVFIEIENSSFNYSAFVFARRPAV